MLLTSRQITSLVELIKMEKRLNQSHIFKFSVEQCFVLVGEAPFLNMLEENNVYLIKQIWDLVKSRQN